MGIRQDLEGDEEEMEIEKLLSQNEIFLVCFLSVVWFTLSLDGSKKDYHEGHGYLA